MEILTQEELDAVSGGHWVVRIIALLASEAAFNGAGPSRYTGEFHG